jgi:hypothetical protein
LLTEGVGFGRKHVFNSELRVQNSE